MKKSLTLCIMSMVIGMVAGFTVCQNTDHRLIHAYDAYNKATEVLLDSLDNQYDWTDCYDPQEYYSSREHLDSLLWK